MAQRQRTFVYVGTHVPPVRPTASPVTDKVWAFIKREIASGRPFPSTQNIASAVGKQTVQNYLHTLRGRGLVQRKSACGTVHGYGWKWSLTPAGEEEIRKEMAKQAEGLLSRSREQSN